MSNAIENSRSPKSQANWQQWEMRLLKLAHFKGLTAVDLATVIDRTEDAIYKKAQSAYMIKRR